MTTRPYADILATVAALAGCDLAPQESARIKYYVNRRARLAHQQCRYWPRFLRVEERIVSAEGLIPFTEIGKSSIDMVIRVHEAEPYKKCAAREYAEWATRADGVQIAGYCSSSKTAMKAGGSLDPLGEYIFQNKGTDYYGTELDRDWYRHEGETLSVSGDIIFQSGVWYVAWALDSMVWSSGEDVPTPDLVTNWEAVSGGGIVTVTAVPIYTAWVTYKAALTDTYGPGDTDTHDVPEEWCDYIIGGAYADWLRNEGATEKAAAEEAIAFEHLGNELEKVDQTVPSYMLTRFQSNFTTQAT